MCSSVIVKGAMSDLTVADNFEDAPPEAGQADAAPEAQYCVFRAGRERFCIRMQEVEEVLEWPNVTRVPLAPPFLLGIFNLRGAIVPVIDIAFTPSIAPNLGPRQIVVGLLDSKDEHGSIRVGIAADEVIGTYTTRDPLLIQEKPSEVPHCCGMLRHEDKLALALDLQRVGEVFPVRLI